MQCDVCKTNKASVYLTQIVKGKMQKVNLCDDCSKAKGVDDPTGFALADLLLGMGDSKEIEKTPALQKCPVCGFTQADFKKTGRLGCSTCYDTFADGLTQLLKAMHKGTEHVGKIPERAYRSQRIAARLGELQKNLNQAVLDENYESAASLRDEIRQLESSVEEK